MVCPADNKDIWDTAPDTSHRNNLWNSKVKPLPTHKRLQQDQTWDSLWRTPQDLLEGWSKLEARLVLLLCCTIWNKQTSNQLMVDQDISFFYFLWVKIKPGENNAEHTILITIIPCMWVTFWLWVLKPELHKHHFSKQPGDAPSTSSKISRIPPKSLKC